MRFTHTLHAVALARTPFNGKFGIPRQAGLVDLPSVIELLPPYNKPEAVNGLEQVSHIWLDFIFSEHTAAEPRLSVRPPRLGGNKKLGVFASRSSFRPNALGQTLVRLDRIETGNGQVLLHVRGIDLLDGTPIVDIKPYLTYADSREDAVNGIADAPPQPRLAVEWADAALAQIQILKTQPAGMIGWISQLIALDPRPAYKQQQAEGEYGMSVFGLNVRWQHTSKDAVRIIDISPVTEAVR